MIRTSAIIIALLASTSSSALAASKWTGCYLAAHGGYAVTDSDTSLDVSDLGLPVAVGFGGLSASGAEVGAGAGCDLQVPNSPFVFGVFGDWTHRDLDHSTSIYLADTEIAYAKFAIESGWTVGGRAGFLVSPATLIYALAGYTQSQTSRLEMFAALPGGEPTFADVGTLKGITVGGGIEAQMAYGWAVKAEYRFTKYDGITVDHADYDLKLDTNEHAARVGLTYRFGL